MAKTKLSKSAANSAIIYSQEARDRLLANVNVLDNNVNSQFIGLQDPSYNKYLELSQNMQQLLRKIGERMDDVATYCRSVIRWIDAYNDI